MHLSTACFLGTTTQTPQLTYSLHRSTQYDDHGDTSEANPSATLRAFEELGDTTPKCGCSWTITKRAPEAGRDAPGIDGSSVLRLSANDFRSQAQAHGVGTVYNVKLFPTTTPQDEPTSTVSTQ
ncbi:hypothetical protein HO173_011864 [Letharia columbiana]|uniref:Uncharacterized protein n=1 Tax=Letharia columbiana TaxID=112416 RepID=A0A8H6FHP7_9LECA|nr:uncharacterized protein HO173_011864 [Letharia columbiana]KAF6228561.1 hypothetical protein HO173_011864 [Letharia columbiana]